jgi:hypothetical protein
MERTRIEAYKAVDAVAILRLVNFSGAWSIRWFSPGASRAAIAPFDGIETGSSLLI